MKLTSLVDALIAAGGTMEQVRAVVAAAEAEMAAAAAALEAEAVARRAKAAAKKRRQRGGTSPDVPGTDGDEGGRTGTIGDPQTPKDIKTNSAHAREARIDPDWEPSPADIEAVTKRGLPPEQLADQVTAFREWHLGAGTLSDGFGMLFRGWVRTGQRNAQAAAKPARSPRGGQPARASPAPGPPSADFVSVDGVRVTPSMVRSAVASGHWPRTYGKPRGDRECRIPAAWFEPALEPAE